MITHAPLRTLCGLLLTLDYLARKNAEPRTGFELMFEGAELDADATQAEADLWAKYQAAKASYKAALLAPADNAMRQAKKLASILRAEVPFPIEEQSRAVLAVIHLRQALSQQVVPTESVLGECLRLWTLADARGEPMTLGDSVDGQSPRKRGRKKGGQPAINFEQLAKALLAISEGEANSTHQIARLIDTSQSSVARNAVIKAGLEHSRSRVARRGFRSPDGSLEAFEKSNDSGNDSEPT
jgi:hypothetical protein